MKLLLEHALPLDDLRRQLRERRCFVGFDGFVDTLLRPIRRGQGAKAEYFHTLSDFAAFLAQKGENSASVECALTARKAGGNNPLLCAALGRLGGRVISVGAYGREAVDPVFHPLARDCELLSFADPGLCFAYEFDVNKVMTCVGLPGEEVLCLQNLYRFVSEERLLAELEKAELVALVNFGEQPAMLRLWRELMERLLPRLQGTRRFYFDLSDCSRLTDKQLLACFEVLRGYRRFGEVYLSLNENEYIRLSALAGLPEGAFALEAGGLLRDFLGLDHLIVRTLHTFWGISENGCARAENRVEPHPYCLTGAGDNQNAGICAGLLCGLPLEQALELGVLTGVCYIRSGAPAEWDQLIQISQEERTIVS